VAFCLKALPKGWRNRLTPLPDVVTAFLEAVPYGRDPLVVALRNWLMAHLGDAPPADVWDAVAIPDHLRMNLRVVDASGQELASGRDLTALRGQLAQAARLSFAQAGESIERRGIRAWDFGDLPEALTTVRGAHRVTGYPALVDDEVSVSLRLLDTRAAADAATRGGIVRLMRIALKDVLARYEKGPPGFTPPALQLKTVIPTDRLLADVFGAVYDRAFVGDDPLPRTEKAFAEQLRRARTRLPAVAEGAFRLLASIAAAHQAVTQCVAHLPPALARLGAEVRVRRDALVYPGFFQGTPWSRLANVPRYLQALERRLVKYPDNRDRDARHGASMGQWWSLYRERVDRNRTAGRLEPGLEDFRWLLEELQVSLFAQELRTPFPVSLKRVAKAWADLGR
jgi:ATP-dependent helicase HrpA